MITDIRVKDYSEIVHFIRELYDQPEGTIPLHAPIFNGNEKIYLNECIESTYVSSIGEFVSRFEDEIALYTGVKKAVACVNGTSALHLALKLSGVQQGHEVITQPLTFIATVNAISYCGARPVFIDVDLDTMGLSPEALNKFIQTQTFYNPSTGQLINSLTGQRISACVPMHTFGFPCRIDEISEICSKYKIPVIEDAAESLGSFYRGKHTGTFGNIGVLSFNGNKIITTGGGGMMLFQDEELALRAKHLTTQAKVQHPWEFIHDEIGFNYRMPNLNAALGLAQLEQLPDFLISKRRIGEEYKKFFSSLQQSGIQYFNEPTHAISNFWLNCIILQSREDRNRFLEISNENGVMTRPAWQLINKMNLYSKCQSYDLQNSEKLADCLVNLPSSSKWIKNLNNN
jgi:perosamine synthetase